MNIGYFLIVIPKCSDFSKEPPEMNANNILFYGKYRGFVVNPIDPIDMGRIQVSVPSVFGNSDSSPHVWAMPCTPYAGNNVGFFAVPLVGANVWVEFEGGDIDYPIWSGFFWAENEIPVKLSEPDQAGIKILKTETARFFINDNAPFDKLEFQIDFASAMVSASLSANVDSLLIKWGKTSIECSEDGVWINGHKIQ